MQSDVGDALGSAIGATLVAPSGVLRASLRHDGEETLAGYYRTVFDSWLGLVVSANSARADNGDLEQLHLQLRHGPEGFLSVYGPQLTSPEWAAFRRRSRELLDRGTDQVCWLRG